MGRNPNIEPKTEPDLAGSNFELCLPPITPPPPKSLSSLLVRAEVSGPLGSTGTALGVPDTIQKSCKCAPNMPTSFPGTTTALLATLSIACK